VCLEKDKYFSSELSQWPLKSRLEPKGHIVPPEKWPFTPDMSWIFYPKTGFIALSRLETYLDNFGEIAIYYPNWRRVDLRDLLDCLNEDFDVRDLECTAYSRLITVRKKPAAKKPEIETAK
jgi:hypothetical protein